MSDPKNGAKIAEKIPALIVFGRFPGSKLNQAAAYDKKDAEAAKKAALEAGLSCLEVKTAAERNKAATLPEGIINAQGRFSLSPASPEIIAELERLQKAATADAGTSDTSPKAEITSAEISADLWQQLKPGSLVLAAWFNKKDKLNGWWEAIIVSMDENEFLVHWRDNPGDKFSRSRKHIALLHPQLTAS